MYRTIVAGTDGSSTAQEAVRHASALAAATGASLHVVSAYTGPDTGPDTGPGTTADTTTDGDARPDAALRALPDRRGRADAVLEHCAMRLPAADVALRLSARAGEAGDVLLSVVDELSADLLVLGTDAQPAGTETRLSGRVAAGARCAVLLVRPPQT